MDPLPEDAEVRASLNEAASLFSEALVAVGRARKVLEQMNERAVEKHGVGVGVGLDVSITMKGPHPMEAMAKAVNNMVNMAQGLVNGTLEEMMKGTEPQAARINPQSLREHGIELSPARRQAFDPNLN